MPLAISEGDAKTAGYSSWRQVAGYFDGDGNVGLEVVKRVLRFKVRFVDTWRPQIESIEHFLAQRGVRCSSIGKDVKRGTWQTAYRLDVTEVRSVAKIARALLKHSVKKRAELGVVIDYLEGRITGNQALEAFNEEVHSGRRRGKIRTTNVPYTREVGLRLSKLENARKARAAYAVNVPNRIQVRIKRDHGQLKVGHVRLSKKYGYSVSVIRRVLGER